jgi:Bacterial Ig domain
MSSERVCASVSRLAFGAVLSGCLVAQAATIEAGILDASWTAPTTNTDGSPLTDLSSYRVYYGTSSSPCPGSTTSVVVASPTSSPTAGQPKVSVRLSGLATRTTYNVSVTAVDTAGSQSACSGVASAEARADFSVSPSSMSFGSVNLGSSADRTFIVSNTEGGVLSGSVSLAAQTGNGANPFTIVSGNPINLSGSSATQNVTIRFTPSTTTTVSTNLIFAVGGGTVSTSVTGSGAGTDTTQPTVRITSPTSADTHTTSATSLNLAGTASATGGVAQVSWTTDRGGNGIASGTNNWSVTGIALQIGENKITVTARNTAGNSSTDVLTVTVNPVVTDTTPPTVAITAPTEGTILRGTVNVSASAGDNVGIAAVRFKIDGIDLGAELTRPPYVMTWNTTTIADGAHSVTAVARDAAGNVTSSAVRTVSVKNTRPDDDERRPRISRVTVSDVTRSQARISWTTDEASDTQVEYGRWSYRNRTPLDRSLVTSHSQLLSSLAPHTWYHFRIRSRDAAGNLGVSREFWFRTDGRDRR